MTDIIWSLKNWTRKGAERLRQQVLLLAAQCFPTFIIESSETVRKKPAEYTVCALSTTFQFSAFSRWETVKWLAASNFVTRDLSCPVIRTAQRPVGCSLSW